MTIDMDGKMDDSEDEIIETTFEQWIKYHAHNDDLSLSIHLQKQKKLSSHSRILEHFSEIFQAIALKV